MSFAMNCAFATGAVAPADFYCPITGELMEDPVTTPYETTFERFAIVKYLRENNTEKNAMRCPISGNSLDESMLESNISLQWKIRYWKYKHCKNESGNRSASDECSTVSTAATANSSVSSLSPDMEVQQATANTQEQQCRNFNLSTSPVITALPFAPFADLDGDDDDDEYNMKSDGNRMANNTTSSVVPRKYICPLTQQIMADPVLTKYGQHYERSAIVRFFARHGDICPMTGKTLLPVQVRQDDSLKREIQRWIQNSHDNNNKHDSPQKEKKEFKNKTNARQSFSKKSSAFIPSYLSSARRASSASSVVRSSSSTSSVIPPSSSSPLELLSMVETALDTLENAKTLTSKMHIAAAGNNNTKG